MDPAFLTQLDDARDIAGIPFVVTSGYRCAEYNEDVGGIKNSRHLTGEAVDIAASTQTSRAKIYNAMLSVGILSFAISQSYGFIHADTFPKQWLGLY